MPKRFPRLLVQDMLDCVDKILAHTKGYNREQLLLDAWACDAILRNLAVLGEAANQLPEDLREKFPDIPWRRIIGFRNRLIHDYAGIDLEVVLDVVENQLEPLHGALGPLLESLSITNSTDG